MQDKNIYNVPGSASFAGYCASNLIGPGYRGVIP